MKTEIYQLNDFNVDTVSSRVAEILKNGGIAVVPTDTIYGIIAVDDNEEAIKKIYSVKNRPKEKKLIRLIGDLKLLKRYTDQYPDELIKKYWPGPLTMVFRGRNGDTVALRYPDNHFLKALFKNLGERAIVAPSANISGKDDLLGCSDIVDEFNGKVEIIVCGDRPARAKASTIIDVSDEKDWKILRQGELEVEM